MEPTRQILWNIGSFARVTMNVLLLVPFGFLAYGLSRRVAMWRRGQPENRFGNWGSRAWDAVRKSVLHTRMVRTRKLYAGVMHALIFAGFILLFIGTLTVMLEDDITVPIFGWSFYRGDFYLGYKLILNLAGIMVIVGVLM